ncbi:DUF2334 domain-containing protein [Solibacillus sp. FSL K6-4121]|uniref:DUF2334 domain-containing protein n=1 Tax=Solibacillus sp. FSL K6-4121 TaxID=2921505 RepID=UPI0030F982FA
MRCKVLVFMSSLVLILSIMAVPVDAFNFEYSSVTFLYEANTEQEFTMVRYIEANLTGHFDEVIMYSFDEIANKKIQSDILVGYKGSTDLAGNSSIINKLEAFAGPVIALGQFYKVAPQFPNWINKENIPIHTLATMPMKNLRLLSNVQIDPQSQILKYAKGYNEIVPLLVKYKEHQSLFLEQYNHLEAQILLNELIASVSNPNAYNEHPSFIIIEHINPLTNVDKLAEVANVLTERRVPILLNVSPNYYDEKTSTSASLIDAKPLVSLLRELQQQGAVIITSNSIDYEEDGTDSERIFYDNFETAVQVLINEELIPSAIYNDQSNIPLAHYIEMSQKTSTFFGKLSLSDDNSIDTQAPLVISNPSLLNRQKLFPITLSSPQYNYEDPLLILKNEVDHLELVNNTVLSTTFSMYDGISVLSDIITTLENVPEMYWYDFNREAFHIKTNKFEVNNVDGDYRVESEWTIIDELKWRFKERPLEMVLWVLVFLPVAFVLLFTINIFLLRLRYRKNLFEERT